MLGDSVGAILNRPLYPTTPHFKRFCCYRRFSILWAAESRPYEMSVEKIYLYINVSRVDKSERATGTFEIVYNGRQINSLP
jgi:hypothetical protein